MNRVQRLTLFVTSLVIAITLIGCSSTTETTTTQPPTSMETTTTQPSAPTETPVVEQTTETTSSPTKETEIMQWSSPPEMSIDTEKEYTAAINTNFGDITVELFAKEAPLAVNNFVFLSRQGFYDGVKVHRVFKGFVMQSGDPLGTGFGGPGYQFADEKVTRDYVSGTLAMANGGPNTNGSQFFITLADLGLPKNYTIFGIVIDGFDVVREISEVPVTNNPGGEMSLPTVDVHIDTVSIIEK